MRQTGHTTVQMIAAPRGAVFVWCSREACYPMDLARFLGRTDLLIVQTSWLRTMRLVRPLDVIVDHAARLSAGEREGLQYLQRRAKART